MLASFASQYGAPAEFVARAPGRVNLIGEHIDYNGMEGLQRTVLYSTPNRNQHNFASASAVWLIVLMRGFLLHRLCLYLR